MFGLYLSGFNADRGPTTIDAAQSTSSTADSRQNRNFIGQKIVLRVTCQAGVTVEASKNVKDQLELYGNDLEAVSQSAADIQQTCRVRNKDIRKFLDGLYVSERGNVVSDE